MACNPTPAPRDESPSRPDDVSPYLLNPCRSEAYAMGDRVLRIIKERTKR